MTETPLAALSLALGSRAKKHEPMARHTTFRVGGPADLYVQANTTAELVQYVTLARHHNVPCLLIGNGSNLLVLDGGVRGLVIENRSDLVELRSSGEDRAVLEAASGSPLPLVANRLSRQGWSGLEWAIGIPGTIGGAVVGNAGAHGGSIADSLVRVTVLDERGDKVELPKTSLGLTYRSSRFKHSHREFVLSATFELTRSDPQVCIERMGGYTEHRRRTQPSEASVGSMFKNPPGDFAGRLVEQAGLKGTQVGGIAVSTLHANFFVNHGGATAAQVLELVRTVQQAVREHSGVALELEIEIVGEGSREYASG